MLKAISIFALIVLILSVSGCDKNTVDDKNILGEWVSSENADSLFFVDDSNFYHSTAAMRFDHYNYSIEGDSIKISYNGIMMVLVADSKHHFELNGDDLMIDFFSIKGFGFPVRKMYYKRLQNAALE
jgi:hypothetical protein